MVWNCHIATSVWFVYYLLAYFDRPLTTCLTSFYHRTAQGIDRPDHIIRIIHDIRIMGIYQCVF